MANNHEAEGSGGGRGRGGGADEPLAQVLWPRSLNVSLAYQVAAFDLLVPSDCRLPGCWKISDGGCAIPPPPVDANLQNVIHQRRNELSEEDRNEPNFVANSDL
jgi:hypothetical protein